MKASPPFHAGALASLVYFAAWLAPLDAAQLQILPVAITGDSAPDIPGGAQFTFLQDEPVINRDGEVAFPSSISGPAVTSADAYGFWTGAPGNLALRARLGEPIPGGPPGSTLRFVSDAVFGADEQFIFESSISVAVPGIDLTNDNGIWAGSAGGLSQVMRETVPVPGLPGITYYGALVDFDFNFSKPLMNDAGQYTFQARLDGAGISDDNDIALFTGTVGSAPTLFFQEGNFAGSGLTWSFPGSAMISPSGNVLFASRLLGPGITNSNDLVYLTGQPGALAVAAREGQPAPETAPGVTFSSLNSAGFNGAGEISVVGALSGPGVTDNDVIGIWAGQPGALELVMRSGNLAPGSGDDGFFWTVFSPTVLSSTSQVAFEASLRIGGGVDSTNNRGLWMGDADSLTLLAREGDPAPEAGDNVTFAEPFGSLTTGGNFVAFTTALSDGGSALYLGTPGMMSLAARTGGEIEVAPGDFRQIDEIFFADSRSGGEDGRRMALNDQGQLVFRADFTDGTRGIFIVEIPEPSRTLTSLIALAAVGLTRRRRAPARG